MSGNPPDPAPEDASVVPQTADEPRRFGNYLLLKELGRGAQGVVYLAEDASLHRKVALKMLSGSGAETALTRERFRREAELASKFEHPGICGVHDFGEVDGVPYIAMQYVRGTTLASLVKKTREGAASGDGTKGSDTVSIVGGGNKGGLEDVLRLVERAARALHVAHEAGLVHRDVKPANIMVTLEGHPVLLDFGLARDIDAEGQTLTQSGQILGTPAYLAPEQIVPARGKVDRRTDIYALGVTLFECLTLRRPFDGKSWDELFHAILEGAAHNPRSFNPRLPRELCTVIEVAMDRDPARRYATAEALAEDLRRVRSFEPIEAHAAGWYTRLRKWSRRRPGLATGAAAGVLFALAALTLFTVRLVQRGHDLRLHLQSAADALVAADYVGAAVSVAKAQELEPDSVEVVELKARVEQAKVDAQRKLEREQALAAAAQARGEEVALRARYEATRQQIEQLARELEREHSSVFDHPAEDSVRGAFAQREKRLEELRIDAERSLLARSEALQRAARLEAPWGGASIATQDALAAFYLERWREALARNDAILAATMRVAVEEHDPRRQHEAELLGRGTLLVNVAPPEAQLELFRWENYAPARDGDAIPRLVPVPSAGVGRVRDGEWSEGFRTGDVCLTVLSVEPDSISARAGIEAGDLVVSFAGAPCDGGLFVLDEPRSALASSADAPLARIETVNGAPVSGLFDWSAVLAEAKSPMLRVSLAGRDAPLEFDARKLAPKSELDLLRSGAPAAVQLVCLRAGEARQLELPADTRSGLVCERTAYPLIRAAQNRIAPRTSLVVDPGSYLIVARAPGREEQRVNVLVDRRAAVETTIELLPEGATPPGFVYVPGGPFLEGGDPQAFRPREGRRRELPGFFIARKELTNGEWYEFVNDPATLAKIDERPAGTHLYLPQDDRVLARPRSAGAGYEWDVYSATSAESPVLGLSWTDARDYVAWRNRKAQERGEPWRYDLPSESEWEKAARGVDGRLFPWGNRFDPALTVCLVRKAGFLIDAPGGFEPRDESPFGVLDMAGSREEWLRDVVEDSDPPRCRKRGGHWSTLVEIVFRCASRNEASQDRFGSSQGLRLVARRQ